MFIKLTDWREHGVAIWLSIDHISGITLMPGNRERGAVTVIRLGNGSHSEWVRETPGQILDTIAAARGYCTGRDAIVAECQPEPAVTNGGAS